MKSGLFGARTERRKRGGFDGDLDITPMIDVTFLLLIFFMVTSTMQATPDIDLPVARQGTGIDKHSQVTISLIEQEAHAPSLASLHRILTAVPISIADFFAIPVTDRNVLFYEADDFAVVSRGAADLRVLGSERRDKKLQLFIERYKPGASTGDEPISFDGETAAVVIQGTIEVEVGGEKRKIGEGGGYQLFANRPYRLRNVGRQTAIVVCACTPPLF